jgi:hypothetical protein
MFDIQKPEWNGNPLPMILDHRSGNPYGFQVVRAVCERKGRTGRPFGCETQSRPEAVVGNG